MASAVAPRSRLCEERMSRCPNTKGTRYLTSLGLYRASRALAALRGRDYVLPDDVKYLAPFVLGHWLILSSQSRLRGATAEAIIEELLHQVPVPVLETET